MSASPAKADIPRRRLDVCFVPEADIGTLFDHLAGFDEQRRWHRQSERLGRLQIDHEIEFDRLEHRQVCWLFPLEDPADIGSGVLVVLGDVGPIADQPSGDRVFAKLLDRRQALPRCKAGDAIEPRVEEGSSGDAKRADALF